LEKQLEFVQARLDSVASEDHKLSQIRELSAKVEAAGIVNNRHTILTLKDVVVLYEQYQTFLTKKKNMLQEEIEQLKLKGITAEQLKEIDDNFKQFDANKDNVLDRKELKACLYSLGEEKTNQEIEKIMAEYGDSKTNTIPANGFKEYMVRIYGDSDTKDEIIDSFRLIGRHDEAAPHDRIELIMAENDVAYFTSTAAKKDNGYDFRAWTDDVFSR